MEWPVLMLVFCEIVYVPQEETKPMHCECQAHSWDFSPAPLPGSWVLLHQSGERLRETKGKRRISQENLLEEVALSYDVKQEQEAEREPEYMECSGGMRWLGSQRWRPGERTGECMPMCV